MDSISGFNIRLVYITAQRQYAAVQKMRKPLKQLYKLGYMHRFSSPDERIVFHLQIYGTHSISKCLHHIAPGMTNEQNTNKKDLNEDQG